MSHDTDKRCFTYCGANKCDCGASDFAHIFTTKVEPDLTTLAGRLRHLRAEKGVSLRQIDGISSAFYSQLETGRITNPGADKLIAIADFFGVSVDWLLGRAST